MESHRSIRLVSAIALASALGWTVAATSVVAGDNAGWFPVAPEPARQVSDDEILQQPLDDLSRHDADVFRLGRKVFHAQWVPPAAPQLFSGLGPMFNTASCASCHVRNGRGQAPRAGDVHLTTVVTKFAADEAGKGTETLRRYGNRLNYQSVANVPIEGELTVSFEPAEGRFADGQSFVLNKPRFGFSALSNGEIEPGTIVAVRMAPPLIGLGLLELVPEIWIRERAAANESAGNPVRGRPNVVWDPASFHFTVGRFGWKADQTSLTRIIAAAFITDMGITSRQFPQENCGELQPACKAAAGKHPAEIDDELLDAVSQYVAMLKPPAPRLDAEGRNGRAVFEKIGCAACHASRVPVVLPDKTAGEIAPYTDMLLHDMGDGLADGMKEATATGREWRTAPLWGIGWARRLSGRAGYLHDGRARSPSEAILWHGGEAAQARDAYVRLDAQERAALLKFLDQL